MHATERSVALEDVMSTGQLRFVLCSILPDVRACRAAICSLRRFYPHAHIALIVPGSQAKDFRAATREAGSIDLIDEDTVLPRFASIAERYPWLGSRKGWYKQQFLKLEYCKVASGPYTVIWDSDTVMLRPLAFVDDAGRYLFTPAPESPHIPYFKLIERVLGFYPVVNRSFISQHQILDTAIVRRMLEAIEARSPGKTWYEVVLDHVVPGEMSGFSEYETYAQFLFKNYPDMAATMTRSWSRFGRGIFDCIPTRAFLALMKLRYDYIVIEKWDSGFKNIFRAARAYVRKSPD